MDKRTLDDLTPDDELGSVDSGDPRSVDPVQQAVVFDRLNRRMFERASTRPSAGRYILLERIGRGGAGVVYRGHDPQLDRDVAIKFVRAQGSDGDDALVEEGRALARLSSPNVVSVYDVGRCALEGGAPGVYVVMELLGGTPLSRWLAWRPHWRQVVSRFCEAGRGLAAAHRLGIVHGDFKPSNVIVTNEGRAVVLDFGLAVVGADVPRTDPSRAQFETTQRRRADPIAGTPPYMAPEHHRGTRTRLSDQYEFCVALYEGLVGRIPFVGGSAGELEQRKRAGPPPVPPRNAAPSWVWAALRRGLAPRPEDRFANIEALLAALQPRRRWPLVAAIGGMVAATAATVFAWQRTHDAGPLSCARSETDLVAQSWSQTHRNALAARIQNSVAGTAALARLDEYALAWQSARRQACAAEDAAARSEQVACLEYRRRELGGLVSVLSDAETPIAKADEVVARLGDPLGCADPSAAAVDDADPRAFAQATGLRATGRLRDALLLVDAALEVELSERARAQWGKLRRQLYTDLGDPATAQAAFREAWAAAENTGDFDLVASIVLHLARSLTPSHPDEAQSLVDVVRARGGTTLPPRIQWLLPVTQAGLDSGAERYDAARRGYENALVAFRNDLPRYHDLGDLSLQRLIVQVIARQGHTDAAYARAEAVFEATLQRMGERHGLTLDAAFVAGQLAHMRGASRRALELARFAEEAAAALDSKSSALHVQRLAAMAEAALGDAVGAAERLERLLVGLETNPVAMLAFRISLAEAYIDAPDLGSAADELERAIEPLRRPGMLENPRHLRLVLLVASGLARELGDSALALTLGRRFAAVAERPELDLNYGQWLAHQGGLEAESGDDERAAELLLAAVEGARDDADPAALDLRAAAEGHFAAKDFGTAIALATTALERLAPANEDHPVATANTYVLLGRAELATRSNAAAASSAQAALDVLRTTPQRTVVLLHALELLARAETAAGHVGAAARARHQLHDRCSAIAARSPPCAKAPQAAHAKLAAVARELLAFELR